MSADVFYNQGADPFWWHIDLKKKKNHIVTLIASDLNAS